MKTTALTPRRTLSIATLTLAWCALWQTMSVANVLSGVLLASALTYAGIGTSGRGSIRPLPLLHLLWLVLVDLAASTFAVAIEIVTPTDRTEEGIVSVTVPPECRQHLLLLIVAITLTPGTAVVDADPDTGTLYLHLLHVDRKGKTIEHVHHLARLSCEALPTYPAGVTQ